MKNASAPWLTLRKAGFRLGIVADGGGTEEYAEPSLSPLFPSDPDYDPDGLSKPNESYAFGCPRQRSVLVILPAEQILHHCRASLATVSYLTGETAIDAILTAMRLTQVHSYSEVVDRVRELVRAGEDYEIGHSDQRLIHQAIDALADLHANVMDFFHQLHQKPYRFVDPVRVVGTDGLVLRVHS